MKAIELKNLLEKMIEKHGDDIEVFIESPGMNYEEIFTTKNSIDEYVSVETLSDYKKEMVYEYHGDEGDMKGPGLIHAVVLIGNELINTRG